jgi:TolA-binding protein
MDFSSAHPSAVLPLKAQYHAGKLLAENSFFEMAVTTLGQVAQSSPGSEEGIQSVFEIGKIQMQQLNQPQQAAGMFNWIIQNFPAHPIAGTARNFLQQIQSGR